MGRTCHVCWRERPHEAFGGGKGLKTLVCKRCRANPQVQWRRVMAEQEIQGFMQQTNMSEKNRKRLLQLCQDKYESVRELADLVLEIAKVHPRKKKRIAFLKRNRPDLWRRAVAHGLFQEYPHEHWMDEMEPPHVPPGTFDFEDESESACSVFGDRADADDCIPFEEESEHEFDGAFNCSTPGSFHKVLSSRGWDALDDSPQASYDDDLPF